MPKTERFNFENNPHGPIAVNILLVCFFVSFFERLQVSSSCTFRPLPNSVLEARTLAKVTEIIEEQEDLMGSQISYKISERSKTDFAVGNTVKNRY